MHTFSLINIGKSIIKSKSSKCSPKSKNKNFRKLLFNSSFKKDEDLSIYPLTNRAETKKINFSPIKINNNNKIIENYLSSASLFIKKRNSNSENNFDIEYFKNISKKNSPIISKRSVLSSVLTNNTKETYKKNFIIEMLKKKREEICKNEKNIQYSFKLRKKEIDKNFNNFTMIQNEYKSICKKEDIIMNYYKIINQKIRSRYLNEEINNKRLKDTIEKTIRDIYKLKDYADFINKLYNISYAFDKVNDNLFYGNKFDLLSEKLIYLFNEEELEKENKKKDTILNDIQMFIQNYNSYEDKIIQLLEEKETIINDTYLIRNENINKLKYLIKRKNNYEDDENSIINLQKNLNKDNNINGNDNEIFNDILKYIIEMANLLEISTSNSQKNTIPDYLKYCKDILNSLRKKEYLIDKYTKEIEHITKSKNKNEKLIIGKVITNRKKYNLEVKQHFIKKEQEKRDELNKIKTLNKIKKKVVKGRIIIDYKNFNLQKKKIKKKVEKNDNDQSLIYSFSEDDKE